MKKEQLSDDVFFEKYTCVENPFTEGGSFNNCMFETYGEEYQLVVKQVGLYPASVWTIIDNNDGWYGIVAGYHWVNRQGYLITEQEWKNEYEEYTIYDTTELREQWDSLPKEAIMDICGIEFIGDDPDELELYKDENFYEWEEMSEEMREDILKEYKTTTE
jgi:hypothetical protein